MKPKFNIQIPTSLSLRPAPLFRHDLHMDRMARPRFRDPQSWKPTPAVCPHCGGLAEVEQLRTSIKLGGPVYLLTVIRCASSKVRAGMVTPSGCPVTETRVPYAGV